MTVEKTDMRKQGSRARGVEMSVITDNRIQLNMCSGLHRGTGNQIGKEYD